MKVLQSCPTIDLQEYEDIKECFTTNWITEGKKSKEFEEEIKNIIGCKYGVLTPNGTLALYLGLKSLGLDGGDKVIVPNHTFIASATSIVMANGIPIFVDVDKENFQIDIDRCEEIMSKNTEIIGIMPVHLYGYACNMNKVLEFATKHNLFVIEDACQALNVSWNERKCGSFGDVGCFSFFADKSLTTGEGGFVSTNNEKIYNKLMYLRNQGRLNRGSFIHSEVGFNFRMTDLQSSIGLTQLKKFDKMIQRRLEIFNLYKENLKNISQVKIVDPPINSAHIPFRAILISETPSQDLMNYMLLNKIEPRSLFYPLHLQPAFKYFKEQFDYKDEDFENSINAFNCGVCLPCHPTLTNDQVEYVCDIIKEYYSVH